MTEAKVPYITATAPVVTFKVVDLREFSFNSYYHYRAQIGEPINGLREAFHAYLPEYTHRYRYTLRCWDMWWDRFILSEDAHDEAETQRAALDDLCDRFDDWDDERHDPHLDAFV